MAFRENVEDSLLVSRICIVLLFIAMLCGAMPSNAGEQVRRDVVLPSGNKVQLEEMRLMHTTDGWGVSFSYISNIDLDNVDAIRSEAIELFENHLREVASKTDSKIIAAVLFAYNEPRSTNSGTQTRDRFGTLFLRHGRSEWTTAPPKK